MNKENKATMRNPLRNPLIICDTATDLVLKDKTGNPILDFEGNEQLDVLAWRREREQGRDLKTLGINVPFQFGGSSAPKILGIDPWSSKTQYATEKLQGGNIPKVLPKQTDAFASGHTYEPAIRRRFCEVMIDRGFKVKCLDDTKMYRCGHTDEDGNLLYPFMIGDVDGIVSINGKIGVLEIKSTTPRSEAVSKYWEQGICPPYYEMQVRHYLCVMNLPFAYICCAWGLRADSMAIIRIDRDMEKEEMLCKAEKEVYDCLCNGEVPDESEDNQELLREFYDKKYSEVFPPKKPSFAIPDEYDMDIREYLEAKEQIEALQPEYDKLDRRKKIYEDIMLEVENKLIKLLSDDCSTFGQYDLDDEHLVFIGNKQKMSRAEYDLDRMEAENPDLFEKGKKVSFVQSKLNAGEKREAKEYMLPREVTGISFDLSVKEKGESKASGKKAS